MRLRELINRLEILSRDGKNDNLEVEIEDPEFEFQNFCVSNAYITRFVSSDDEYDYIIIRTT